MGRFVFKLLALFVVAAVVAGCANYNRKSIEVRHIKEYAANTSVSGVALAAQKFSTPEQSKAAFDEDVTAKGFIPVQLIFENQTDQRILILRASVQLESPSGRTFRPVNSATVADAVKDNKMAYALLGFGIFSYQSAEDANNARAADYLQKSLPENLIISPRRLQDGFVFFNVGSGVDISGYKIDATAELMKSNNQVDLSVRLP